MTDGWNRRLDPTPLEGGAPIRLDLPCAVAGADGPGLEGLARAGTPLVGEPRRVGGVEMVPATFLWRSARPGTACVVLHLNSLTDNHREDLRPALMEPVGATGWWALCCLLPSDGVLSYQVVESASPIPSGTGRTRDGWLAFHMAGLADPHCPGAIANGRAMPASLWHGPSARAHPDWARAHGPDAAGSGVEVVEAVRSRGGGCGARSVELVRGVGRGGAGQEPGVLVLFDAANWRANGVVRALSGRTGQWDLVLVDTGRSLRREAALTDPGRVEALVGAIAGVVGAERPMVVCGQSYGGLACAHLALTRPDLVGVGVCQSGSYWVGGPQRGRGEGSLLRGLTGGSLVPAADARVVVQVGSHEAGMVGLARSFAAAAGEALVGYREYRGGHDYAWWRYGLSDALDRISAM